MAKTDPHAENLNLSGAQLALLGFGLAPAAVEAQTRASGPRKQAAAARPFSPRSFSENTLVKAPALCLGALLALGSLVIDEVPVYASGNSDLYIQGGGGGGGGGGYEPHGAGGGGGGAGYFGSTSMLNAGGAGGVDGTGGGGGLGFLSGGLGNSTEGGTAGESPITYEFTGQPGSFTGTGVGGAGGAGGNAIIERGAVEANKLGILGGGAGGAGGNTSTSEVSGAGGAGGAAGLTATSVSIDTDIVITGGAGSAGGYMDTGYIGAGAAGGAASLNANSVFASGNLSLSGGVGGADGEIYSSASGAGGAATLEASRVTLSGTVTLTGGNATTANGGAVSLKTDNLDANALTLSSGTKATSGTGGSASLVVQDTLRARNLTFTKNNGAVAVKVKHFSPTGASSIIVMKDTAAADVKFDRISLGNSGISQTLGIKGANGASYGELSLIGKGHKLEMDINAKFGRLSASLPANLKSGDVVLTSTNLDLSAVKSISIKAPSNLSLANGEKFMLIKQAGIAADAEKLPSIAAGRFISYALLKDPEGLVVSLQGDYTQAKAFAEAGVALLFSASQGQDLFLSSGLPQALRLSGQTPGQWVAFGGTQGYSMRLNSGSHVDISGFGALAGLAWRVAEDSAASGLVLGAFVEGGAGSYDSHNGFNQQASVDGDGNSDSFGGGIFAQYDLQNFRLEASIRSGYANVDFDTDDIVGGENDFSIGSWFYGGHLGLGYAWDLFDRDQLDLYARLLWTHQSSDSDRNGNGEKLHFDSSDSLRSRLGARYSFGAFENWKPYLGAAWEHEFESKVKMTINGQRTGSPSLRGSSGIGELGMVWQATPSLALDLGLQGYTGKREGVTGMISLKWTF